MRASTVVISLVLIALLPREGLTQSSPRRPYCEIASSGAIAGPSADVCEQIARRWQLLVGSRAIRGAIRLVDGTSKQNTSSAQDWVLEWPAPQRGGASGGKTRSDGFVQYIAENILTHEAAHLLFGSYTIFFTSALPRGGYASVLPDWFDEAPAVWIESASLRTARVKRVAGSKPSLTKLITMDHPGRESVNENAVNPVLRSRERTVTPPCAPLCTFLPETLRTRYRVSDIGINAQGRPDTNVWYSATNPNKVDTFEDREFYPLSYMLLRFIHARGGTIAVRELISRYREDPSPRTDVLVGLPGLPASFAAVERAWHAYLRKPPPEDR